MPLRIPDAIMTEEDSSMAGSSHFSAISALSAGSQTARSAYYAGTIPPSPGQYRSAPFYSSNASVASMDSTDISLKRDREREGRCSECGMQTHDIQVDPRTHRTKKVPLTVENEVHRGRCLLCHPIATSPSDNASVNSVSTHGTPRSQYHYHHNLPIVPDNVDSSSCNNSIMSTNSNSPSLNHHPNEDIQQALNVFQSESADLCDVLAAMRRYPNEACIQARGCEKLWVQSYDEETSAAIGRVGGIATILEAMTRFVQVGQVQQSGCEVLQNLADTDEYNRDVICENGGILTIVRAMESHGANRKIQESGCTALANLAHNHDVHTEIANAGGVHVIMKAAQGHSDDENVMRAAYQALRALGYTSPSPGSVQAPTVQPQEQEQQQHETSSQTSRRSRRSRASQQQGGDVVRLDEHGFPLSESRR